MPQLSEKRPFEALQDRLLRAGIAPRHVRRYLRELEDHRSDLTVRETARGYDGAEAASRARALLGNDDELALAMTASGRFRSLTARLPWVVFGLIPPLLIAALLTGTGFMMAGLWHLAAQSGQTFLTTLAQSWTGMALHFAPALTAVFFTIAAMRQRMAWQWPLFAVVVTALLGAMMTLAVQFPAGGHKGAITLGMSLASGLALWGNMARFCLTAACAALACGWLKLRAPLV